MSDSDRRRVPEAALTSGLAQLYRFGMAAVFVLLLVGLLHPLAGWDAAGAIMDAGVILLFALPVVTVVWVGIRSLLAGDRQLVLIVLGIVILMAAARLVPTLF